MLTQRRRKLRAVGKTGKMPTINREASLFQDFNS